MYNDLKEEMNSYSNERLLKKIAQQKSLASIVVKTAKEIAKERGILTDAKLEAMEAGVKTEIVARPVPLYRYDYSYDDSQGEIGLWTIFLIIVLSFKIILMLSRY